MSAGLPPLDLHIGQLSWQTCHQVCSILTRVYLSGDPHVFHVHACNFHQAFDFALTSAFIGVHLRSQNNVFLAKATFTQMEIYTARHVSIGDANPQHGIVSIRVWNQPNIVKSQ